MDQKPVFTKRKLALWYTRNFKPIMTHRELEPIMINLGFLGLPPSIPGFGNGSPWKEYIYKAGEMCWDHHMMDLLPLPPPRPRLRLPYPRIDGLHIMAYEVFLDAINFYIKMDDISLLFHVRGMPIRQADTYAKWRYIDGDESFYLYREGTADPVAKTLNPNKGNGKKDEDGDPDGWIIGNRSRRSQPYQMVPYSEILVQDTVD